MTSLTFILLALMAGMAVCQVGAEEPEPLVVEMYIVTEPEILRNYQKLQRINDEKQAIKTLKQDVNYYIFEVNKYFASLKPFGVDIQLRIKSLHIASKTEIIPECKRSKGGLIQSDFILEWFKEWLQTDKVVKRFNFDMALLLTGFDLYSTPGKTSPAGYANVGRVCERFTGIGIVEYDMTQITAITMAHEIAHILGSGHSKGRPDCPFDAGYIMAPEVTTNNKKRWEFSNCTAEDIKKIIRNLDRRGANCMKKTNAKPHKFNMKSLSRGTFLTPEGICERKLKTDSYFCSNQQFYGNAPAVGDIICQYILCAEQGKRNCQFTTPTDGMACDVGKRCSKGKCIAAPKDLPTRTDRPSECFHGDIKLNNISGFGLNCEGTVKKHKARFCRSNPDCCESCKKIQTGIPGCQFGDRSRNCAQFPPEQICLQPANVNICCQTCLEFAKNPKKRSPGNGNGNGPARAEAPTIIVEDPPLIPLDFARLILPDNTNIDSE